MSYVRSSEQSSEQLLCRAGPGDGRSSVWAGLGAQCGADSQPADMLATRTQETDKVNTSLSISTHSRSYQAPGSVTLVHRVENVICLGGNNPLIRYNNGLSISLYLVTPLLQYKTSFLLLNHFLTRYGEPTQPSDHQQFLVY